MPAGKVYAFDLKQPVLKTQLYVSRYKSLRGVERAIIGDVQTATAIALEKLEPSGLPLTGGLYFDVTVYTNENTFKSKFKMLLLGLPVSEKPSDFNEQCDLVHDLLRRAVLSKHGVGVFVDIISEGLDEIDFIGEIMDISIEINQHAVVGTGHTVNSRIYQNIDVYQMAIDIKFETFNNLDNIHDRVTKIMQWAEQAETQLFVDR
jgi:hypothetical protein